ncbi:MAG TPA: hypothetical protein VGK59_23030 [Ohtaekwangia sp.]
MSPAIHYEYADGSANRYVITATQLEYIPVKPEESSTGMYSGGEPKKVTITPQQFEAVQRALEQAINTPSIHIPDRMKTSGLIIRKEGDKTSQYILKPKSEAIAEIENLLNGILGR